MALICNKKILLCHALRGLGPFTTRGNESQCAHARKKRKITENPKKKTYFCLVIYNWTLRIVLTYVTDIVILLY